MALSIALYAYIIHIEQKKLSSAKGKINTYINENLPLDNFDGSHDVLMHFQDFLHSASSISDITEQNKSFKCQRMERADRVLRGIIKCGIYGITSEITNRDTGAVDYARQTEQADMIPYFYLVYSPLNSSDGILLLQSTGGRGIKQVVSDYLAIKFADMYTQYRLVITPYYSPNLFSKCLNEGSLESVQYLYESLPSDIVDVIKKQSPPRTINKVLKGITSVVMKGIHISELISLFGLENYNALKRGDKIKGGITFPQLRLGPHSDVGLKFKLDGHTKNFYLSALEHAQTSFPISGEDVLIQDGHPQYESLIDYVYKKILPELCCQYNLPKPSSSETYAKILNLSN